MLRLRPHRYRGVDYRSTAPSGSAIIANNPASPSDLNIANQHAGFGQVFTTPSDVLTVTGGRLELDAQGEVFGTFRFVVYATSGGVATGAPLTYSPLYALDSVPTSYVDVYFTLASWSPAASTAYALFMDQFDNYGRNTADGRLQVHYSSSSSYGDGTRLAENLAVFPSWLAPDGLVATGDVLFDIYGTRSGGGTTVARTRRARLRRKTKKWRS